MGCGCADVGPIKRPTQTGAQDAYNTFHKDKV